MFKLGDVKNERRRAGTFTWLHIVVLWFLPLLSISAGTPENHPQQPGSEKPLPDLDTFLKEIRGRLHSNRSVLISYTYKETETHQSLDKNGKVNSTKEMIYQVYPSPERELYYRRLISKDGKPTSPKDLKNQDREQEEKREKFNQKLEREGTDNSAHRLAKKAEAKKKEDKAIDDLFRLYEITMEGREWIDGHPAIIVSFRPHPGMKPQTDEGKILAKTEGRAWFSETEFELIRIEVELIDNLSLGWSLLARMNKGATIIFQRRKVNNEVWLPIDMHFSGSARLFLVKTIHVKYLSHYSDFQKFNVDTHVFYDEEK